MVVGKGMTMFKSASSSKREGKMQGKKVKDFLAAVVGFFILPPSSLVEDGVTG